MYKRRMRFGEMLKRFVLITLAIALVVGVGSKIYAGYRVRTALDDLTGQLATVGDLRYLDVSTTYDGKIHIEGLSFYPGDLVDMPPLITEEAVIITPGMLYLVGLEGGRIPNKAGLSLVGMWVDLADISGLADSGGSLSGNPFEALQCGNVENFRAPDLQRMGYPEDVRMDMHLRYELAGEELRLYVEQSSPEISGFSISLTLQAPDMQLSLFAQSVNQIRFAKGEFTLSASEFNKRRNRFCAEQTGVSEEEFKQTNLRAALRNLEVRGMVPSDAMIEHYKAFMSGEGTWRFTSKPEPPVSFTDLVAFDFEQMLEWLDIRSTINSQSETVFQFARYEPVIDDDDGGRNEDEGALTGSVDQRIALAQTVDPWVQVDKSRLREFVEKRVNVMTSKRKSYVGYLVETNSESLRMETRVTGGVATIPIPLSQVLSIKVKQSTLDAEARDAAEREAARQQAADLQAEGQGSDASESGDDTN